MSNMANRHGVTSSISQKKSSNEHKVAYPFHVMLKA